MKHLEKMAQQDAEMYAAAEMAYGTGAGTRRKLAYAEIEGRYKIPGYYEAFASAYDNLDMDKFAKAAIKERKHLDRVDAVGRNVRALHSGNTRSMTTGVAVVFIVATYAHKTGLDKPIIDEAKVQISRVKAQLADRKRRREVHNVTHVHN